MKRQNAVIWVFAVLTAAAFVLDVATGPVQLSVADMWNAVTGHAADTVRTIVVDIRLVRALVAAMAGAALSVAGLEMQTLFRNPLAGPYVLGISSGASLGVALFVLGAPALGLSAAFSALGLAGIAWLGAIAVLGLIAMMGRRVKDIMVILILGMMFSSAVGAVVQILQYAGNEQALKTYVLWTMGSLGEVTWRQMPVLAGAVALGLLMTFASVKSLNLLLMGEDYARTMGMDAGGVRRVLFLSTALLAGTVTAFCGPIGFIGLAMPHAARAAVSTGNHQVLLPATLWSGAGVMLLCDFVSRFYAIPVNAVTALVGIPVVVWVVMKNK